VSDYGLDDRAIGVRFPAGAKDFSSSLCVQTSSGAHPASCTIGTGGPFPGGKSAAGAWRWPLTPIYFRGREWVGAIPPLPQAPPWRVAELLLPLLQTAVQYTKFNSIYWTPGYNLRTPAWETQRYCAVSRARHPDLMPQHCYCWDRDYYCG
jgi:hypothetical protein